MIQVVRVFEPVRNYTHLLHDFSIIATDTGFSYVFGTASEPPFDSDTRVKNIMDLVGTASNPKDSNDYLALGETNLSYYVLGEPFEAVDPTHAANTEQNAIDQSRQEYQMSIMHARLLAQSINTADVFQDFPDLEDQLSSTDPNQKVTSDGMTNLVMVALGAIDPNGPNGWLLDHFSNNGKGDGTNDDDANSESSSALSIIVDNESNYDSSGMPLPTGDDQ